MGFAMCMATYFGNVKTLGWILVAVRGVAYVDGAVCRGGLSMKRYTLRFVGGLSYFGCSRFTAPFRHMQDFGLPSICGHHELVDETQIRSNTEGSVESFINIGVRQVLAVKRLQDLSSSEVYLGASILWATRVMLPNIGQSLQDSFRISNYPQDYI